jgi:hypothetical protein
MVSSVISKGADINPSNSITYNSRRPFLRPGPFLSNENARRFVFNALTLQHFNAATHPLQDLAEPHPFNATGASSEASEESSAISQAVLIMSLKLSQGPF